MHRDGQTADRRPEPGAADAGSGALTLADWRQPDRAERQERRSASGERVRRPSRGERPAGLEAERETARKLVSSAKSAVTSAFEDVRFGRRINVGDLEPVVSAIAASIERNPAALPSVTRLKDRHEYTYLHSVAVCGLMVGLARELGLAHELTMEIGLAGLLHDVGKARVSLSLLDKPGPLNLDEYALIQQHTLKGFELLTDSGIESPIALDVVLHHHERPDGRGYPGGISAETLSVYARMGAVCDVYDAVTSSRAYKDRWAPGEALDWMAGTEGQFDRRVLSAFRRMIGVFPVGSFVRLESHRLGVVLNEPPDHPSQPDVCTILCAMTGTDLPPRVVSTRRDPIIGLEMPGRWKIKDWDQRRGALLQEFGCF